MIRHLLWCCVFISFNKAMCAFDIRAYCVERNDTSQNTFLEQFPYQEYLETVDLHHYLVLKRDRDTLNKYVAHAGDEFLYRLLKEYLTIHPIDVNQLDDMAYKIKLAETYYQLPDLVEDCPPIFLDMSDELMTHLSKKVEEAITTEKLPKASFEAQMLTHRLASNGYLINIPVSQLEKLQYNVEEGNYAYIWDRIQKRMWFEFWAVIGLFSFGIIASVFLWRRKSKANY